MTPWHGDAFCVSGPLVTGNFLSQGANDDSFDIAVAVAQIIELPGIWNVMRLMLRCCNVVGFVSYAYVHDIRYINVINMCLVAANPHSALYIQRMNNTQMNTAFSWGNTPTHYMQFYLFCPVLRLIWQFEMTLSFFTRAFSAWPRRISIGAIVPIFVWKLLLSANYLDGIRA